MDTMTHEAPATPLLAFRYRCSKYVARGSTSAPRLPAEGGGDGSLRSRGAAYIRLLRACLSQFLLKEPTPPKNLLYVSPFSLASYLTKASSMVQR